MRGAGIVSGFDDRPLVVFHRLRRSAYRRKPKSANLR